MFPRGGGELEGFPAWRTHARVSWPKNRRERFARFHRTGGHAGGLGLRSRRSRAAQRRHPGVERPRGGAWRPRPRRESEDQLRCRPRHSRRAARARSRRSGSPHSAPGPVSPGAQERRNKTAPATVPRLAVHRKKHRRPVRPGSQAGNRQPQAAHTAHSQACRRQQRLPAGRGRGRRRGGRWASLFQNSTGVKGGGGGTLGKGGPAL